MKQRQIARVVHILLVLVIILPQSAQSAELRPAQFVKEFYTWYITTSKGTVSAIRDAGIYQYVAPKTVEYIKSTTGQYGSDRRDYFCKSGDPPLSMEGVTIDVGKVTDMGAGTFVVPVTIVSTFSDTHQLQDSVVVVLKKIDGALKILKCVDIYPEA